MQITQARQSIDFKRLRDVVIGEDPMSLSAISSSGLEVNLRVASGPAALTGDGSLQFFSLGPVTIAAEQPGNANYLPAEGVTQSFSVISAPRNVTLHRDSGSIYLTFQGESGRTHAVESTSQLNGVWSTVTETTGSGLSTESKAPLPEAGNLQKFFRIQPRLLPATFGGH